MGDLSPQTWTFDQTNTLETFSGAFIGKSVTDILKKKKKKETRIYVDNEIVFWIIKYLKPIKITLFLSEKWWWAQILNALTKSLIFTSFLSIDYVRNCIIGKGADYKGTISITKSGIQCQAWNSMIPHEHR